MSARIDRLEEILAYSEPSNPWLKLYYDHVKFPNGQTGRYNRIVESEGRDGVAILPLKGASVGLVRQYRYPVSEDLWEIPRGFADGPEPRVEAARELEEETGLKIQPGDLLDMGPLHPNTGLLSSVVRLFAANCTSVSRVERIDDGEISQFNWFEPEQLNDMISEFEIRDAFTLSAICRAALLGYRRL